MTRWVDATCVCCLGATKALDSAVSPMGSSKTRVRCDACRRSCHPQRPCRLAEALSRA